MELTDSLVRETICGMPVSDVKGKNKRGKGGTARAKALGNDVPGVLEEHQVGQ